MSSIIPNSTALRGLRTLSHRHYQSPSPSRALTRTLWNGTTQPYIKHAIPHGSTIQQHQASQNTPLPLPHSPASGDSSQIRKIHTKYIQDLLSQQGQPIPIPLKKTRSSSSHSLSEPPQFRTDGPLTPYPISLDTGERLEPRHATVVRIVDRGGAERSIVVAEVDDRSGNQTSILLALDLQDYTRDEGTAAVGRRITAEEMYATLGIEAQGGKF
ncbi:hypothetical protein EG328_001319 [Venturia inaequalis]|uniref:Uncharacterized protein n=1 Tax=Venturia inaequalis TaxID=5025 RepID=A0A8H3Z9Z2_VENIN|nr:hypothetical protein EG328_001319 [Venturia inaequalis]KAE9991149.1 hypothetical protein EG327_000390 [Venturia inaequalis]RDI88694.1 hypothetical protein Vi05172_g1172 [Venturia inaequalis]